MPVLNCPHRIKQFLDEDISQFTAELQAIERIVDSRETPEYDSEYYRLQYAINTACQACEDIEQIIGYDQELLDETRRRFRKKIAPWFDKSQLIYHAKTKPQGYPGDYKMLLAIYGGKTLSPGIGGYLDLCFLNMELGKAVPARMKFVTEFLEQQLEQRAGDIAILNVACGPCEEFAQNRIPLLGSDRNIRVAFLDYDRDALAYVEENVIASRADRDQFRCIRYNAVRMQSADRFIKQFGKFDILYSVGLCDYLENRLLIPILRGWRKMTNENGLIYVSFKDQARYDKYLYQWVADWHFLQRSQRECLHVLEEAGFDLNQVKLARDETGSIMNFIAPVTAPRQVRTDSAHEQAGTSTHLHSSKSQKGRLELSPNG